MASLSPRPSIPHIILRKVLSFTFYTQASLIQDNLKWRLCLLYRSIIFWSAFFTFYTRGSLVLDHLNCRLYLLSRRVVLRSTYFTFYIQGSLAKCQKIQSFGKAVINSYAALILVRSF